MFLCAQWRLWLVLPIGLLLLSGCDTLRITDPNSPFYIPPPGTRIIVHQRLEIPAGHTRVFLQHGRIIPKNKLNEYAVNCNFEINTLGDYPRYIEPDTFTVMRSNTRMDSIVSRGPLQLASNAPFARDVFNRDDGPSMMFEEIQLTLKSERQTDVRELACRGAIADLADMELPRLAEIRQALGEYATIEISE